MGSIQVNAAGLQALAAHCAGYAAQLGAHCSPSPGGGSFQPSALAVQAAHTDVATTSARLSARMTATAAAASAAAANYTTADIANAADISAVATTAV